jgi:hypothetical protein
MRRVFNSRLERRLRFLALTLAWFSNDDGERCFPSVATLAQMIGCQERQVREDLDRLRRLGVVIVTSAAVEGKHGARPAGGKGRSTVYRFDLERLERLGQTMQPSAGFDELPGNSRGFQSLQPSTQTLQSSVGDPAGNGTKPCTLAPLTLHPTAPDPLRDPSGDPSRDPSENENNRASRGILAREETPNETFKGPINGNELMAAYAIRRHLRNSKCAHDPSCRDRDMCLVQIAWDIRAGRISTADVSRALEIASERGQQLPTRASPPRRSVACR